MSPPRSFAAVFLAASAILTQVASSSPVLVTVYYGSKCPESRDFVINQLLPAVLRDPELVRPVLVPFGKANVTADADGYMFSCQHGPSECLGNKWHACGLAVAPSYTLQVLFAACMLSEYSDVTSAAMDCAGELGLPYSTILQCVAGNTGDELLRAYGRITKDLKPPLTCVPTVTLNGSGCNQKAILKNFWKQVNEVARGKPPRGGDVTADKQKGSGGSGPAAKQAATPSEPQRPTTQQQQKRPKSQREPPKMTTPYPFPKRTKITPMPPPDGKKPPKKG